MCSVRQTPRLQMIDLVSLLATYCAFLLLLYPPTAAIHVVDSRVMGRSAHGSSTGDASSSWPPAIDSPVTKLKSSMSSWVADVRLQYTGKPTDTNTGDQVVCLDPCRSSTRLVVVAVQHVRSSVQPAHSTDWVHTALRPVALALCPLSLHCLGLFACVIRSLQSTSLPLGEHRP